MGCREITKVRTSASLCKQYFYTSSSPSQALHMWPLEDGGGGVSSSAEQLRVGKGYVFKEN